MRALALLGIVMLFNVGTWYKHHGLARIKQPSARHAITACRASKVMMSLAILLLLIFSKFFYLASISSYYTFYLIHTFGVSVQSAQVHLFFFLGAVAVGHLGGRAAGRPLRAQICDLVFHPGHRCLSP